MKLLLDENLSRRLLITLGDRYPGSVHVDRIGLHGRSDLDVWEYAALHGFAIVSKDDDFRQLSFLRGAPPKVVRLVAGNAGTGAIAALLSAHDRELRAFDANEDASLLILGNVD